MKNDHLRIFTITEGRGSASSFCRGKPACAWPSTFRYGKLKNTLARGDRESELLGRKATIDRGGKAEDRPFLTRLKGRDLKPPRLNQLRKGKPNPIKGRWKDKGD